MNATEAEPIGVRWVDDKLNVGLYVYSMEVKFANGEMDVLVFKPSETLQKVLDK